MNQGRHDRFTHRSNAPPPVGEGWAPADAWHVAQREPQISAIVEPPPTPLRSIPAGDRLLEGCPNGLSIHDQDRVFIVAHGAWRLVAGCEPADLVGLPLDRFVHPDDLVAVRDTFAVAAAGIRAVRYRWRLRDGAFRWLETTLQRLPESDCELYSAATRDVSEQVASEEAARAALRVAESANLNKTAFLARVSHEIRTPMTAVLGLLDLVLEGSLAPEQRDSLEIARDSAASLLHMAGELIDISKAETNQLELEHIVFDVRDVVDRSCRALSLLARNKGISLDSVVLPGAPMMLQGDPARLRQVLINLIGNAVKYTDCGSVLVRVEPVGSCVRGARCQLVFSVHDTGLGIDAEQHEHLFDGPHSQPHSQRRREGAGLGLRITRDIVGLMGGVIWAESTEGHGASFYVRLPFFMPKLGGARKAIPRGVLPAVDDAPGRSATAAYGARVLAAEDDAACQILLRRLLQRLGCEVVMVDDGQSALDAATSSSFDLALIDVQMPALTGLQVAERIRVHEAQRGGARLPIVGLTAHAQDKDRLLCLTSGMDDYLPKPIDLTTLSQLLDRHLSRRMASSPPSRRAAHDS